MAKSIGVYFNTQDTRVYDPRLGTAGEIVDLDGNGEIDYFISGNRSHGPLIWSWGDAWCEWLKFQLNLEGRKDKCKEETRRLMIPQVNEHYDGIARRFAEDASRYTFCEIKPPRVGTPEEFYAVQGLFSSDEGLAKQLYDDFVTALKEKNDFLDALKGGIVYKTFSEGAFFGETAEGEGLTLRYNEMEFVDSRGRRVSVFVTSAFMMGEGDDRLNVVRVSLMTKGSSSDNDVVSVDIERSAMMQPIQAELNALLHQQMNVPPDNPSNT